MSVGMNVIDLMGWRITGLRNRIADRFWERRLGINTQGAKDVHQPDSYRYVTLAYSSIMKILVHVRLLPDDVLVDIGCGKGRVVCCASRFDCKEIVGVDIDKGLCEIAQANAKAVIGRQTPVRIVNLAAQ